MRCPACSGMKDKVVDSRTADDGAAIRRRRECLACSRRFTTYERVEEVPLMVVKRSGLRQAFERTKVVRGLLAAAKNRPVDRSQLESVATEVEELLRMEGHEHPSSKVGELVLGRLRHLDEVASIRFASVYKGFDDPGDFEREVDLLGRGERRSDSQRSKQAPDGCYPQGEGD